MDRHGDQASASLITACKARDTLPALAEALEGQRLGAGCFELVLVDNGPDDGVCPTLARNASFPVKHLQLGDLTDVNRSWLRNQGLEAASGDVAIFLDADTLPGPDFVSGHLRPYAEAKGPLGVIGYTYAYPLLARDRTPEALQPPPIDEVLDRLPGLLKADPKKWEDGRERPYRHLDDLKSCRNAWIYFWTNNASVSRPLALELGGFDEEFKGWGHEDVDLAYRCHRAGARFVLSRPAWAFHYPHAIGNANLVSGAENARVMVAKHGTLDVELAFLGEVAPGAPMPAEAMKFMLSGRLPESPPVSPEVGRALLSHFQKPVDDPRSLGWLGGWPDVLPADGIDRYPSPEGRGEIIGLVCPVDDQGWAGAVVLDHWRQLRPKSLVMLCRELTRAADMALLVWNRQTPPGALVSGSTRERLGRDASVSIAEVEFTAEYGAFEIARRE